jgi:MFS family permease
MSERSRGSLKPLLPVLLTALLDLLGFGLVIPLLSYYAETFAAGPIEVTLLMASYSLAQFVGAPLWGMVSDRIGRRPVMLISIAGTCLALAGFAASTSLAGLFVFRILNGLFAANISTAQAYVADATTPADRARGMGLIGAAFGVGFSLGPWFGGELSRLGLTAPIWAAAALSAVNFLWAYTSLPESRPAGARAPSGRTLDPRALIRGVLHPVVGLAVLLTFSVTFAFSMMEATFALVSEHSWGLDAVHVGRMFLVIGLVGIVVQGGLIGRLARRFGEPTLVVAGMVCNATGLLLLALAAGSPTLALVARWAGCALVALGTSLANPCLGALISRGVGADEQGAVLGANQSLSALARALAPTTGGLLYHGWFRGGAFAAGGLVLLAALPLAVPAVRRASQTRAPAAP